MALLDDPTSIAPAPERARLDALLSRLEMWGQKLGLERILRVLDALGGPQLRVPHVLVAGTNGKGSTSALLAATLHAAGYRVGLYTSPHLERVEERLRIDGQAIGSGALAQRLEHVLAAAGAEVPTYFETLTAAAFLHFAEQELDIAVFEVGLGGRLDATNAGDPLLSIVTAIGFDHEEHLGTTLAAIAHEKAGIARAGRPLLANTAEQPEVEAALRAAALRAGARFEPIEVTITEAVGERERTRFVLHTDRARYRCLTVLAGAHQIGNVALAVRAAEHLRALGFPALDVAAIERGLASCRWPGRLEWVTIGETSPCEILLDGAHNPAGVRALVDYLADLPGPRCDLLFGALCDKRAEQSLGLLAPLVGRITLTRPASERALSPRELATQAGLPGLAVVDEPRKALWSALRQCPTESPADVPAEGPARLLVCGSLYLLGEIRQELRRCYGQPAPAVEIATSSASSAAL